MKRFKDTPWPWEITDDDGELKIVQPGSIEYGRGEVSGQDNANLIAAAPELLEALQKMLSKAYKQNWNDAYPEELKSAQDAINKALGE